MPSGITSDIYEGKDETLRGYLMKVGRGMGFAIMQRDDSYDEPVKQIEPNTSYYDERIEESKRRLDDLRSMTAEAADQAAQADFETRHAEWERSKTKTAELRARYEDMIRQVQAWTPDPLIANETETKKYALKYLYESIDFDCGKDDNPYYQEPIRVPGEQWRTEQILEAERDLEYSEKNRAEELERAAERNKYIAAFLRSLPAAEDKTTA